MRHLATTLVVTAAVIGAAGTFVFMTERGAANEIKGFVLLLIAAVLFVGGCVLRELAAIRRALERKS
jgi:high-affinity Fe2+/Pb2+ permease